MQPAFSTFREPHAWLLRGLVEYGWPDVTRAGGRVPPGHFGGFDLSKFSAAQGREGVSLHVPAVADGQWLQEDGIYELVVRLTREEGGALAFAVRCPEANYLETFPFDPQNPTHAAGYVHQALTAYVPQFVRWRRQGGEVSWSQRAGLPQLAGEPCSQGLSKFIEDRVIRRQPLDEGQAAGWWLMPAPGSGGSGVPIATMGKAAENEMGLAGLLQGASRAQAEAMIKRPGGALSFLAGLGIWSGVLWLLNIPLTIGMLASGLLVKPWTSYVFSFVFSLAAAALLLAGGGIALAGARRYKRLQQGILPYFAIFYAAASPFCCFVGVPVAAWALVVWNRPLVKEIRAGGG